MVRSPKTFSQWWKTGSLTVCTLLADVIRGWKVTQFIYLRYNSIYTAQHSTNSTIQITIRIYGCVVYPFNVTLKRTIDFMSGMFINVDTWNHHWFSYVLMRAATHTRWGTRVLLFDVFGIQPYPYSHRQNARMIAILCFFFLLLFVFNIQLAATDTF